MSDNMPWWLGLREEELEAELAEEARQDRLAEEAYQELLTMLVGSLARTDEF